MNLLGQFVFISFFGKYLQAHTDGEMHASQDVGFPGDEETWNVYTWPDATVSLQNCRTNFFLSAEPSGRAIANRPVASTWEKWQLQRSGGDSVALLGAQGMWLCAQNPGNNTQFGGEVIANRTQCLEWEHFTMQPPPDSGTEA